MPENISGLGRKRPQLNIPIDLLDLDSLNPRLAKENQGSTQLDLLHVMYDQFDVEEIAFSMAENGYFDEEPIVVVPQKLPKGFVLSSNIEKQQKEIQSLIPDKKLRFTVVEGNRRVAALKLLLSNELRNRVKVGTGFPEPSSKEVENDLKIIPSIFYRDRDGISAYLGVRHIAGLLKWEAYAKAVYVASRIEEGIKNKKSVEESIKNVQRQTADRSDVIKKQYLCFKVLQEAEEDLSFDIENVKNRFSLITVALNAPSIRDFIGVESYKKVNFSKRVVPKSKLENLERLLTWIYGNNDTQSILTDSRKITSRLAPILSDQDSTEYLLKYQNLEDAYERSGGEKKFLIKKINDATKNLRNALSLAYKYKSDKDILAILEECISAAEELKKSIKV